MLGNENIVSKPRAGRALPPRCRFLHCVLELKMRLLKRGGPLATCVLDALLHMCGLRKKTKTKEKL